MNYGFRFFLAPPDTENSRRQGVTTKETVNLPCMPYFYVNNADYLADIQKLFVGRPQPDPIGFFDQADL